MFCSKCGKDNKDDTQFCSSCGAPLKVESAAVEAGGTGSQRKNKGKSEKKKSKWWLWTIIGIIVVIIVIAIASGGGGSTGDPEIISMVKNGHLSEYPRKTIGEAFNNFFGSPRWGAIVAEDGNDYVNVTGKIMFQEKKVNAAVQFKVDKDAGTFEINAFEINEVSQMNIMLIGLLENIYEE